MTKTIEEGILDVLIAVVIHCYNNYYEPWREERKVEYQNRKNQERDDSRLDEDQGVAMAIEEDDHSNFNSLDSIEFDADIPLSVQEESQQPSEHDRPVFNLREDVGGYLTGLPAHNPLRIGIPRDDDQHDMRADDELRFDFDKYFPWLDEEYAPVRQAEEACLACGSTPANKQPDLPSFLKNRVGVKMVSADEFVVGTLPTPPPVYVDNVNRQVVISQKTLETLISLIPWGNLQANTAQTQNQERENTATGGRVNTQTTTQSALATSTSQVYPPMVTAPPHPHNSANHNAVGGGAFPVYHPIFGEATGAVSAPPADNMALNDADSVSTALKVLSVKCLPKIARFRLQDTNEGTNANSNSAQDKVLSSRFKGLRDQLKNVKQSGISLELIDHNDTAITQEKSAPMSPNVMSPLSIKMPGGISNSGQRSPNNALLQNPFTSFVHNMATAPTMTPFSVANRQISGLVRNDLTISTKADNAVIKAL